MFLSPPDTPAADRERYSRHMMLPAVGPAGQAKLRAARVLLVGAGGLGSPAALYLAAAGVGALGIVDDDRVDLSNLQRQVLHGTADVGRMKLDSAADRLRDLNPGVAVEPWPTRLNAANALGLVSRYDLVVDGCDNFPTRYAASDACAILGKPLVFGAVHHFDGQVSVFHPAAGGPCYRCLFPEPPPPGAVPGCAEAGVLGVTPGLVGMLQATEAIKLIVGLGRPLVGRLLLVDTLEMQFRTIAVRRRGDCPACGDGPRLTAPEPVEWRCDAPPAVPNLPGMLIAAAALRDRLAAEPDLPLLDVRNPDETARGVIAGARLLPLPDLTARMAEIDDLRDRPFVVYCQGGVRSARACQALRAAGFRSAIDLAGGYAAFA